MPARLRGNDKALVRSIHTNLNRLEERDGALYVTNPHNKPIVFPVEDEALSAALEMVKERLQLVLSQ